MYVLWASLHWDEGLELVTIGYDLWWEYREDWALLRRGILSSGWGKVSLSQEELKSPRDSMDQAQRGSLMGPL